VVPNKGDFITKKTKEGKDLKALELPGTMEWGMRLLEYHICGSSIRYLQPSIKRKRFAKTATSSKIDCSQGI